MCIIIKVSIGYIRVSLDHHLRRVVVYFPYLSTLRYRLVRTHLPYLVCPCDQCTVTNVRVRGPRKMTPQFYTLLTQLSMFG